MPQLTSDEAAHLDSIVGMAIGDVSAQVPASSHAPTAVALQGNAVTDPTRPVEHDPGHRWQGELAPEAPAKRLRTGAPLFDNKAVTLCRRGLNIQWPFSQLILTGDKTEEIRDYDLDHRGIANTGQQVWLVETKGPIAKTTNAIVGDLQIAPNSVNVVPDKFRVVPAT